MLSIRDVQETWGMLEAGAEANTFRVRELVEIQACGGAVLFGIEQNGVRHVLLPVPAGTAIAEDRRSAGVQIRRHTLIDGEEDRLFVDITCSKPHLHEIFSLIAADMLRQLRSDDRQPDRLCHVVLNRWRELLERAARTEPSLETIVGLFGEMTVLRHAVRQSLGAFRCWAGPEGARHDFVSARASLEVKTTLRRRGRFAEINGHEQLEQLDGRALYLSVLRLEEVNDRGECLRDLLEELMALGVDAALLVASMEKAGVAPEHLEVASTRRFVITDHVYYVVDETFPKITSRSFASGSLPQGVLGLRYTIDLSGPNPTALSGDDIEQLYTALAEGA